MIYLDTHVVVWLYSGEIHLLSETAKSLVDSEELRVSPMVLLELAYLNEIERISKTPKQIVSTLERDIDLKISELSFQNIVECSLDEGWCRDPFDRLIVANTKADKSRLLTKDQKILRNFKQAVW